MTSHGKRFDYLNLEVGSSIEKKSIDEQDLRCFALGNHKHKFHSDHTQLNLISDFCALLVHNSSVKNNSDISSFRSIIENLKSQSTVLGSVVGNLDYIKSQLDLSYLQKLPLRKDIQKLVQKLDSETKQLERENQQNIQLLYHQVVVLNQKLTDLSDTVSNLKEQISSQNSKLDKLLS